MQGTTHTGLRYYKVLKEGLFGPTMTNFILFTCFIFEWIFDTLLTDKEKTKTKKCVNICGLFVLDVYEIVGSQT